MGFFFGTDGEPGASGAGRHEKIRQCPGRRGAHERNRRGFAAHTATQEQEHQPRPRSVSFDYKWPEQNMGAGKNAKK